jgi:hypothetical protein
MKRNDNSAIKKFTLDKEKNERIKLYPGEEVCVCVFFVGRRHRKDT